VVVGEQGNIPCGDRRPAAVNHIQNMIDVGIWADIFLRPFFEQLVPAPMLDKPFAAQNDFLHGLFHDVKSSVKIKDILVVPSLDVFKRSI